MVIDNGAIGSGQVLLHIMFKVVSMCYSKVYPFVISLYSLYYILSIVILAVAIKQ